MDLARLQELIDQKYIDKTKHPTEELWIYNYSQKAQFDKVWTPETITCRGLIMDASNQVVARPFQKFWNLSEHQENNGLPKLPLTEPFEVFEKMDGSLGIMYFVGGKPFIATRGSFESDQAIEANKMLQEKYSQVEFNPEYTYLFEIIYPENRIVVNYGLDRDLYLLTAFNTRDGVEVPYETLQMAFSGKMKIVRRYDGLNDLEKIKAIQKNDSEGFVIRFQSGMRTKFKFDEYVRLHRLLTGVNKKTIWDLLRNGQDLGELMERVPEEFYHWVKDTADNLILQYNTIDQIAKTLFITTTGSGVKDRKTLAMEFMKDGEYAPILFSMLDKRPYAHMIWKKLRPVAERPFKQQSEAVA
ncbi:MAG: hypothetical protein KCHDKBKB_00654 [Elusimicrobia bacterium]|nr:hypothetical protein [Elusimicrobiota bacterium]